MLPNHCYCSRKKPVTITTHQRTMKISFICFFLAWIHFFPPNSLPSNHVILHLLLDWFLSLHLSQSTSLIADHSTAVFQLQSLAYCQLDKAIPISLLIVVRIFNFSSKISLDRELLRCNSCWQHRATGTRQRTDKDPSFDELFLTKSSLWPSSPHGSTKLGTRWDTNKKTNCRQDKKKCH